MTDESRLVIVVGAGGRIGTAICRSLAPTAAQLVIVGQHRQTLSAIAGGISGNVTPVVADLGDPDQTKAAAGQLRGLVRSRGDVFVYNAGYSRSARLVDIADADFEAQLAVNFSAAFFLVRQIGRAMADIGGGRIVFISSSGATAVHADTAVYDAAKAALESLARSVAVELGQSGVRANVVRLGHILSGDNLRSASPATAAIWAAIPRGPGRPEDVAAAVRWLASDDAAYVSGATLDIDGGRSAQGVNSAIQGALSAADHDTGSAVR